MSFCLTPSPVNAESAIQIKHCAFKVSEVGFFVVFCILT